MAKSWTMRQLKQELRGYEAALKVAGQRPNSVETAVGRAETFLRWLGGAYTPGGPIGAKLKPSDSRRQRAAVDRQHRSHGTSGRVKIENQTSSEPFEWRWPSLTVEHFPRGWEFDVRADNAVYRVRHAITEREAFGRLRVRSVTWVNGQPTVEGTETETYGHDRGLASVLKINGRQHVRVASEMPPGYERLSVVRFSDVVNGPNAFHALAVQLAEDNIEGWARHAILRHRAKSK